MQRQSLVPLHSFMQGRGQQGASTKMLEVACGTGRFATFVKVFALWALLLLPFGCDFLCLNEGVSVCLHVSVWLFPSFLTFAFCGALNPHNALVLPLRTP